GYALSVAVEQLLGSVDWVLDPANNQIKYKDPNTIIGPFVYTTTLTLSDGTKKTFSGSSPEAAHAQQFEFQSQDKSVHGWVSIGSCTIQSTQAQCSKVNRGGYSGYAYYSKVANPAYDPNAEDEYKTIPLPTVAQQVINNAAGGDASAQQAIVAAAQDIINEAETDQTKARPIVNQLEANAKTQTDESATAQAKPQADPVTGQQAPPIDITLEFPVFCSWAPVVCEAAQTVISFPTTLTDWWNTANQKADSWASSIAEAWASVKEWATGEPDLTQDQTDLPIEEQTLDRDPSSFDTDYIVLGSQCPSFEPYTVEVGPISKTLSMDLSPLCDFAAQVRPAILGMSYLTAAGIVVAAIRET
ncbi:MAG: virulence factor TspB C-terminal domain-related protein, partial [Myroides sp.]